MAANHTLQVTRYHNAPVVALRKRPPELGR